MAGKITRKQLAAYCGLSVRTIDELTRGGVLAHFRIGKSIRYDLAETEAALRQRFYVEASSIVSSSTTNTPTTAAAATTTTSPAA